MPEQKTIALFGAGKSSTILIEYLIAEAGKNNWRILIADTAEKQVIAKMNNSLFAEAFAIDVKNDLHRSEIIKQADIVISLMPPSLHFLIALDCVAYQKNLLTASYVDENIKALEPQIKKNGLLFLCEMGLDPGIDHMSAMKIIDSIHENNGQIISFKSHCGGLVAPESDNNPWHYKISWNPKNVVLAGKSGAVYKSSNQIITEKYETLFDDGRTVSIPQLGILSYYPNRDSCSYIDLYHLKEADTFIRTTLRYPGFIRGWKKIIELKLTDEIKQYQTDGSSLHDFFTLHFRQYGFDKWLEKSLNESMNQKQDENSVIKQLLFLGINDKNTIINKGLCSAADILQFILEKKLALQPGDKDMIVMMHELIYMEKGEKKYLHSTMLVKGEDGMKTAMAKTVGLPLGIAAKLILNNSIHLTGLRVPVAKEIYDPVLKELESFGILFSESVGKTG
jgi:saccharopine dehydrogenase-like NADP-dependent oxidoreductase